MAPLTRLEPGTPRPKVQGATTATIRNIYFKCEWVREIVTPHKFYSIMLSVDASSILSVAKFLLSAFNHRKKITTG